jgi:hypothetical protein
MDQSESNHIPEALPVLTTDNEVPIGITVREFNDVLVQEPIQDVIVVDGIRSNENKIKISKNNLFTVNVLNLFISFLYKYFTDFYILSLILSFIGFSSLCPTERRHHVQKNYLRLFFLCSVIQIQIRMGFLLFLIYKHHYYGMVISLCGIFCDSSLIMDSNTLLYSHINSFLPEVEVINIDDSVNLSHTNNNLPSVFIEEIENTNESEYDV